VAGGAGADVGSKRSFYRERNGKLCKICCEASGSLRARFKGVLIQSEVFTLTSEAILHGILLLYNSMRLEERHLTLPPAPGVGVRERLMRAVWKQYETGLSSCDPFSAQT
jgi:hypothetical protein